MEDLLQVGTIFAGESMKLRILCHWTTGNINESYGGDSDNHFSRSRTWTHTGLNENKANLKSL